MLLVRGGHRQDGRPGPGDRAPDKTCACSPSPPGAEAEQAMFSARHEPSIREGPLNT